MARENQGLQVALIIFVMLFVVSLGTTLYFFNVSQDARLQAKKSREEAAKNDLAHRNKTEDCKKLKKVIGVASTEKVDAIEGIAKEEFETFGATFPEGDCNYRQLLKHMFESRAEKEAALKVALDKNTELVADLDSRTDSEQAAVASLKEKIGEYHKQSQAAIEDYQSESTRVNEEQSKVEKTLKAAQNKSASKIKEFQGKLAVTNDRLEKISKLNQIQAEKIDDMNNDTFEVPDGEIRWVNQQTRTVWINLGRAHHLMRQVTFSVYPSDVSDLSQGGKKASIEVIRVLGDNSAEARIVEDKITDPIMPGDKIHTPAWSPGEQKRFALAGLLDIDGDGRSDLDTVRHIITMNGGAVDCYYNAKGEQIGEITIDTKFLVLGEAPDDRANPKITTAYSQMKQEAGRWGSVKQISLDDLLNRMGYKKGTGAGGGSAGGSRGQFKSRRPPARAGAY